ncbi:hypothetical protein [uncultured Williamsia sp.]|uniref:hypothetical protein n=1 Tax=uncultured Williamsia sp. TaxID=259311 RepID=UPI00260F9AF2|nr:hypothetical protein [uncultured Williamsia sp.]
MSTPERGIRRARAAAVALGVAALGAIGVTSGLAYADTDHATTPTTSTTSPTTDSSAGTDSSTGSTDPDSSSSGWGTAPTVSSGRGDSHAQTNGS